MRRKLLTNKTKQIPVLLRDVAGYSWTYVERAPTHPCRNGVLVSFFRYNQLCCTESDTNLIRPNTLGSAPLEVANISCTRIFYKKCPRPEPLRSSPRVCSRVILGGLDLSTCSLCDASPAILGGWALVYFG